METAINRLNREIELLDLYKTANCVLNAQNCNSKLAKSEKKMKESKKLELRMNYQITKMNAIISEGRKGEQALEEVVRRSSSGVLKARAHFQLARY